MQRQTGHFGGGSENSLRLQKEHWLETYLHSLANAALKSSTELQFQSTPYDGSSK